MTDSFDLLERLCNHPGGAGFERIQRPLIDKSGMDLDHEEAVDNK